MDTEWILIANGTLARLFSRESETGPLVPLCTFEHPQVRAKSMLGVIDVVATSNFGWQAMRMGFLQAGAKAYFDKSTEFIAARDWIARRAMGGPRETCPPLFALLPQKPAGHVVRHCG